MLIGTDSLSPTERGSELKDGTLFTSRLARSCLAGSVSPPEKTARAFLTREVGQERDRRDARRVMDGLGGVEVALPDEVRALHCGSVTERERTRQRQAPLDCYRTYEYMLELAPMLENSKLQLVLELQVYPAILQNSRIERIAPD